MSFISCTYNTSARVPIYVLYFVVLHKFWIVSQLEINSHLVDLLGMISHYVDVLGIVPYHLTCNLLHIHIRFELFPTIWHVASFVSCMLICLGSNPIQCRAFFFSTSLRLFPRLRSITIANVRGIGSHHRCTWERCLQFSL